MSGITDDNFHTPDTASGRLLDPAFKLFGRTIPMGKEDKLAGEEEAPAGEIMSVQDVGDIEYPESEEDGSVPDHDLGGSSQSNNGGDEGKMVEAVADGHENQVDRSSRSEAVAVEIPCAKEEERNCLDEAPKEPDKPVPCPRCESLDTKFCYFNNYNINQPRHFCKNCQRYWTAGGTLRNVPVGAGRRKNKPCSISNKQIVTSDGFVARSDVPAETAQQLRLAPGSTRRLEEGHGLLSSFIHPGWDNAHSSTALDSPSPPSTAVLRLGQESPTGVSTIAPARSKVLPCCELEMSQAQSPRTPPNANHAGSLSSLCTVSNLSFQKKKKQVIDRNPAKMSFESSTPFNPAMWQPSGTKEPIFPPSTDSSQLPVPSTTDVKQDVGCPNDFSKYVDAALAWASSDMFPLVGGPWQYGANLVWGNGIHGVSPSPNGCLGAPPMTSSNPAGGTPAQPPWAMAMGPWAPSGIPWPLLQNPLWVAAPAWASAWTMPWMTPFTAVAAAAAAAAAAASCSSAKPDVANSVLGKHPRDQVEAADTGQGSSSLLVPKTLRIGDPGETARSSIWTTLGLELPSEKMTSGGIFGNMWAKVESRDKEDTQAQDRNFNPAALNRATHFQESRSMPAQNADVNEK